MHFGLVEAVWFLWASSTLLEMGVLEAVDDHDAVVGVVRLLSSGFSSHTPVT